MSVSELTAAQVEDLEHLVREGRAAFAAAEREAAQRQAEADRLRAEKLAVYQSHLLAAAEPLVPESLRPMLRYPDGPVAVHGRMDHLVRLDIPGRAPLALVLRVAACPEDGPAEYEAAGWSYTTSAAPYGRWKTLAEALAAATVPAPPAGDDGDIPF